MDQAQLICGNCGEAVTAYGENLDGTVQCPSCRTIMLTRADASQLIREGQMQRAYAETSVPDPIFGELMTKFSDLTERIYIAIEDTAGGEHEALWTLLDIAMGRVDDALSDGDATMGLLLSLLEPEWPDLDAGELTKRRPRLAQIAEKLSDARRLREDDLIAKSPAEQAARARGEKETDQADGWSEAIHGQSKGWEGPEPGPLMPTDPNPDRTTLQSLLLDQLKGATYLEARCQVCGDTFNPGPEDIRVLSPLASVWDTWFNHLVGPDGAYCGGLGRLTGFALARPEEQE